MLLSISKIVLISLKFLLLKSSSSINLSIFKKTWYKIINFKEKCKSKLFGSGNSLFFSISFTKGCDLIFFSKRLCLFFVAVNIFLLFWAFQLTTSKLLLDI